MTYDDFHALCEKRRSIHYFDRKPVQKEDILKLLALARLSPSVENTQPWHFHVILDPALRGKLMKASLYGNFVEGAAAFVLVTCDITGHEHDSRIVWNPRELEYSCMAAMENILLGAAATGLGSCWVSLHHGQAHDLLGLPKDRKVIGGIMLGHYRRGEEPATDHHERRPLEQMVTVYE